MAQGKTDVWDTHAALTLDIDIDLIPGENFQCSRFTAFPIDLGVEKDPLAKVQKTGLFV
jgi:hypothetical protein